MVSLYKLLRNEGLDAAEALAVILNLRSMGSKLLQD